eukprot:g9308.t1
MPLSSDCCSRKTLDDGPPFGIRIDARDVLIVPDGPLSGLGEKGTAIDTIEPFWEESQQRLQRWWDSNGLSDSKDSPFVIITGFVCSTMSGRRLRLRQHWKGSIVN